MQTLLEMDLASLSKIETRWLDGEQRFCVQNWHKVRILYWVELLRSAELAKLLAGLKDQEFILLAQIAKRVALLSVKSVDFKLTHDASMAIIEAIEQIHRARYDHKLRYLRAHPKLMIEAKAELRRKEPGLIEHEKSA